MFFGSDFARTYLSGHNSGLQGSEVRDLFELFSFVLLFLLPPLPWYNCNGWLGVNTKLLAYFIAPVKAFTVLVKRLKGSSGLLILQGHSVGSPDRSDQWQHFHTGHAWSPWNRNLDSATAQRTGASARKNSCGGKQSLKICGLPFCCLLLSVMIVLAWNG